MESGIVFDIKQMALFDGPGIRTTVFLKGCPLHCQWCHNPEGQHYDPELMVSHNSCLHCGRCMSVCEHPDHCTLCGKCIEVCPLRLRKICGTQMTADELAAILLKDKEYLKSEGGGVTFSGGEPTGQPEFLSAVVSKLADIHKAIETCGFCTDAVFQKMVSEFDLIIMDIKLIDRQKHKEYVGVDNTQILKNLEYLKSYGKPFWIRIPVIPGVNDSKENFQQTAELLKSAKSLQKVELLPYHKTAGAKYSMVDRKYQPTFDSSQEPNLDKTPFLENGLVIEIM